jgi:hypothetical protein
MTDDVVVTFSGTHAFDPTVLADTDADEQGNADQIIEDIEAGRCPRCRGPLPTMPEFPAGSRITRCRSIPICRRCGWDEVCEQVDAGIDLGLSDDVIGGGLSPAGEWPLLNEDIEERRTRHEQLMKPAVMSVDGGLLTENGVADLIVPRNTGGWLQYGFATEDGDDDDDDAKDS